MKRVNVKGNSGSGKSTFAAALAQRLDLPYIELDELHWGPDWTEATGDELLSRTREAMNAAPDGWVIDGNYERKLGNTVIDAADMIVWLDLPFRVAVRRLWRRTADRIHGDRELWGGNKESWRGAFWGRESLFLWMVRSHFRHRREWPARFAGDPRLVRLRSAAAAQAWLEANSP